MFNIKGNLNNKNDLIKKFISDSNFKKQLKWDEKNFLYLINILNNSICINKFKLFRLYVWKFDNLNYDYELKIFKQINWYWSKEDNNKDFKKYLFNKIQKASNLKNEK